MGSSASAVTFDVFPIDLLIHTLSFASAQELGDYSRINKLCLKLVRTNEKIWRDLCLILWKDKVYVPQRYLQMINLDETEMEKLATIITQCDDKKDKSDEQKEVKEDELVECAARRAYRLSYLDGTRTVITMKEMTEIKWYFHFKGSADNDWENAPKDMTRMVFHDNGIVDILPNEFTEQTFNGQDYVWKFHGSFHKTNKYGNAIQINRFPREIVTRNPKNWGFVVQNTYVIYTSFPIPDPDTDEYKSLLINYYNHKISGNPFGKAGYIQDSDQEWNESMDDNESNDNDQIRAIDLMALFVRMMDGTNGQ